MIGRALARLGWALALLGVRLVGPGGVQAARAAQAEQARRAGAFELICEAMGVPLDNTNVAISMILDLGLAHHRQALVDLTSDLPVT